MDSIGNGKSNGRGKVRVNDGVPDHFVRPTAAASIPANLVFVDCESHREPFADGSGERQIFRLGVAIGIRWEKDRWTRRDVLRFTDIFEFWEWLLTRIAPKNPVWVFSHNLSCDSTWLGVWERVDDGTLSLNLPCPTCGRYDKRDCKAHHPFRGAAVVSDPPVILCFKSAAGIVRLVDTLNYWKTSIAKLGRGVGYPKILVLGPTPDDHVLFQLCETDAEIVEKSVCQLLAEWQANQCGHFASTAAGCAWAAFRRTIEPKQILIDHGEPHTGMERAAYYGGQAEAYYVGRVPERVWLLDVRSLYPHCMRDAYFPVQFLEMGRALELHAIRNRLLFDCAVAHVVIRTDRAGYPYRIPGGPRPIGFGDDGRPDKRVIFEPDRLGFPVGRYTTNLAGPELSRALHRGEVEQVIAVAWYRAAKLFGRFVDEWFARRPDQVTPATFARDLLAKTVLNSLAGYFGKHKLRWKDRPGLRPLHWWGEWHAIHAETGKVTRFRAIGGAVQELEEGGESRDSFPGIAAYITSYGREHMLWLRDQLPRQSVYYQDTDSLIVNADGLAALNGRDLVGAGELGKLKLLGELTGLTIHAVKDYQHDRGRTAAGIKFNAESVGPGVFQQEKWESIAEQWSRTPDGSVKVVSELIHLSRTRMPRRVQPDGWTLPPHVDTKTENPF
jgi:DNA polymerase type B, organellar and viral